MDFDLTLCYNVIRRKDRNWAGSSVSEGRQSSPISISEWPYSLNRWRLRLYCIETRLHFLIDPLKTAPFLTLTRGPSLRFSVSSA